MKDNDTMCERKISGKNIWFAEERKNGTGKEENDLGKKMPRCVTDRRTHKIVKIGLEFWTQNSQYFPALFAAL